MLNNLLKITIVIALTVIVSCGVQPGEKEHKRTLTRDELISLNRRMVEIDADEIKDYVEKNNLEMTETKTGLWYRIDEEGEGNIVTKGNVVEIKYEVRLLDSTFCYSSDSLGTKIFKVGQGGVEAGLEEGILLLKKNSKATFIMPPHRAYGLVGDDDRIPGRTSIVYKVEVVGLKEE